MTDAQDIANEALGLPRLDDLLRELAGLDEITRRRRIHEVIRLLGALDDEEETQIYRDAITHKDLGYFKPGDWRSAMSQAKKRVQKEAREQAAAGGSYVRGDDGCLYLSGGGLPFPLLVARFVPQVVADVIKDDGAERTRVTRIQVTTANGRTGEVDVPPEKLRDARVWAVQAAGPAAAIAAISRGPEHVLAAAQILGEEHQRFEIYSHTGWRHLGGAWHFLTASGALNAKGLDDSVTVDLGSEVLNRYRLPDPHGASADEIRAAVRASLDLRSVAAKELAIPQLSAVYRAPLPLHPDVTVWVTGLTGLGKTALAALMQQHFGAAMDSKSLPANWASTGNALEGMAFSLANVLMVVDDYNPQGSDRDQTAMRQAAERLIRGSANAAGRGRQRRDGTPAPQRFARAQLLSTAEDTPQGQSLQPRLFMTEVESDLIEGIAAAGAQTHAANGVYSLAMAAYVTWLAERRDEHPDYPDRLRAVLSGLRAELTTRKEHRRIPEAAASLLLGWGCFLRFAEEIGAVSDREHTAWFEEGKAALTAVAAEQSTRQSAADPVQIYGKALVTAVTKRAAYLADIQTGAAPANASRWGWIDTDPYRGESKPGGSLIGWVSDGQVFLDPGAAHEVALEHARRAGTPIAFGAIAIRKRLNHAGLLASTDGKNLMVVRTLPGGARNRVLHVNWDAMSGASDDGGGTQQEIGGDGA